MLEKLGEGGMSGKSGNTGGRDLGRAHLESGISTEYYGQET